ncbi:hypothetical protein LEMLEM_LOCUS12293 [Lemmus lemmus]
MHRTGFCECGGPFSHWLSVSWRSKEPSDMIQSESEDLGTGGKGFGNTGERSGI